MMLEKFFKKVWNRVIHSRYSQPIVLISLLAMALLRALQGLNMADDGFVLTAYKLVFTAPESVCYMFLYYWLINIGGIWDMAFGSWGIYGFRILECIILVGNVALIISILHKLIPRWAILSGIVLTCMNIPWIEVFEYNSFSSFIAILAIVCIIKALGKGNWKWMFLAGVWEGLNIFVRLPNICMCLFVMVLLPYYHYTRNKQLALRLACINIIGVAAGVLFTIGYMAAMGHIPLFMKALHDMALLANGKESSHGIWQLAFSNFYIYGKTGWYLCIQALCFLASWLCIKKIQSQKIVILCCTLIIGAYFSILWFYIRELLLLINGLALISCIGIIYLKRDRPELVYYATLGLLMAVLLPQGSDGGILTIGIHSLWAAMPLVPYAIALAIQRVKTIRVQKMIRIFVAVLSCVIGIKLGIIIWEPGYYEHGTRLDDVCRIRYPLANVLTDKETAAGIEGVLRVLSDKATDNDTVLVAGDIPLLHYLTSTLPYLHNPWPWIFGDEYLTAKLYEIKTHSSHLPIVVCKQKDFISTDKRYLSLHSFLKKNNYSIVYNEAGYIIFCVATME